jgi:hypothetical protein
MIILYHSGDGDSKDENINITLGYYRVNGSVWFMKWPNGEFM